MSTTGRRGFMQTGSAALLGLGLSEVAGKAAPAANPPGTSAAPEASAGAYDAATPFHLGLVTYNLARDWDIETIIKNCERAGFEGVELRTTHKHGVELSLTPAQRAEVKRRFASSRVRLVSLGTTCEYESPNPAVVQKNIEETRRWCELARDLGCRGVKVRPNAFPKNEPHEKTLDQIGKALSKCGEFAREFGVEIWLEVHGEETEEPHNIHHILSVANHPLVGACWNCNPTDVEGGSVAKSFELLKPWIKSCHINDLDRKEYPWHELFALLRGMNYDRYTFAEVADPSCEPVRFMSYYHALWDYTAGMQRP